MTLNESLSIVAETLNRFSFGWVDYTLFSMVLVVSLAIGVYFGFFSKQDSSTEYLLGGKRMGSFPVATSIIASHVSGITLLGIPSEVYEHGSQYSAIVFTTLIACLVTAYVYLPVFFDLQLTSTFEYLELRFSRSVRTLCSLLFILSLFMYLPIVVYVPALAFSHVTDISVHVVTPVLCAVCILYTSIGGLKAVVWSDTIQFSVTVGGLFVVLGLGLKSVGGLSEVWRISDEGGRLIMFDMNPSPYVRNSFWTMVTGMSLAMLAHTGINQGTVQRFLSVPRERQAKNAIVITAVGLIVVKLISVLTGLIIYAKYSDCDPISTKMVKQSDQLLPFYVMDVAGNIPGLPGLFVAGLVSAALATMSAGLNTVSGIIYEDFLASWIPDGPSKGKRAATIMKLIVVVVGMASIGLVFLTERLGTVFQIAVSMRSVTDGPLLGLFTVGMLLPWVGRRGAIAGGYSALATTAFLVVGSQWHIAHKRLHHAALPTSVSGCAFPLNETIVANLHPEPDYEPMALFRISFMHFSSISVLTVVVVSLVVSFFWDKVDLADIDPRYISPLARRFLPKRAYVEVPLKDLSDGKKTEKIERNGDSIVVKENLTS